LFKRPNTTPCDEKAWHVWHLYVPPNTRQDFIERREGTARLASVPLA
jgi:hypothetical protein